MSQKAIALLVALLVYLLTMTGGGSPGQQDSTMPGSSGRLPAATESDAATALQPAVVDASEATLRSGPGTSYDAIVTLPRGTTVTVRGLEGDWYQVALASGQTGWMWKPLLRMQAWSEAPSSSRTRAGSGAFRMVVGYYVEDANNPSYDSLVRYAGTLTAAAPWAWLVTSDGNLMEASDAAGLAKALRAAGTRGLDTYALVHNFQNGTFDAGSVHGLLSDPSARRRAVSQISAQAARYGVGGVNLDFENVPPSDRQLLTAFVRELAEELHAKGMRLSIAMPAKTSDSPANAYAGAFDYPALGALADSIWLMTYDEHYRTGPPGPVSSVTWAEKVVRYAVSAIPPSKVLLGLPAYGYEWPVGGGAARAVTYTQAMARLEDWHATLRWHPTYKVPYYATQSRQVWFENRYSAGYKLALVERYGLGGVAIWRLGQEDPGLWDVIDRTF